MQMLCPSDNNGGCKQEATNVSNMFPRSRLDKSVTTLGDSLNCGRNDLPRCCNGAHSMYYSQRSGNMTLQERCWSELQVRPRLSMLIRPDRMTAII